MRTLEYEIRTFGPEWIRFEFWKLGKEDRPNYMAGIKILRIKFMLYWF